MTAPPRAAAMPLAALLLSSTLSVLAAGGAARGRNAALPVTKVIQLLEGMQKDLVKEAREEQEVRENMVCWCETNEKKKGEAVEDFKQQISSLEAKTESTSARTGQLSASIAKAKSDIAENEQALREATELRKEEAAAFHKQEKELLQSVQLLKGAIAALSEQQPAMLQRASSELATLRPALRHAVHRNLALLGWLRSSSRRDLFLGFINAHPDILDPDYGPAPPAPARAFAGAQRGAIPVFKSYAPQSGQILGVLKQMQESFEEDLPQIQAEETKKAKAFAELKGAKTALLAELYAQKKAESAELSKTNQDLIAARDDLKDTKASLNADQQFLLDLVQRCKEGDHAWDRRSKLRQDEIQAVSEAIAVLDSDEVRDAQQTTFGFVQVSAGRRLAVGAEAWRRQAARLLGRVPARSRGQLTELLESVKADPFVKVVAAVDKLITKLKAEQADEVKRKDFCNEQLHENAVLTERKKAEIKGLDAEIAELDAKKAELTEEVANLQAEIKDLRVELQRASEDRKLENLEFRKTVADQLGLSAALEKAHAKLADFYMKDSSLVQRARGDGDDPAASAGKSVAGDMPELKDHENHEASNHVMTLLKKLAGEAKIAADESVHDEQAAQAAYEALVAETFESVKAKSRLESDKAQELTAVEEALHETHADKDVAVEELEALVDTGASLHQQCDWLLKHFTARQEARAAEMEGLNGVKAILRGMN